MSAGVIHPVVMLRNGGGEGLFPLGRTFSVVFLAMDVRFMAENMLAFGVNYWYF